MEERFNSLEGRLDLLDRRLLSTGARVDDKLDACVQRSNERINDIESRTFRKCNETGTHLVQIEDKWHKLAYRCYRSFQKLGADLAELRTTLKR
jgi:hypothetical protein